MSTAAVPPPVERGEKRDTTINVRLSAKTRDLIDSAADMLGKTRSEFMIESARLQAIDVLLDQRLLSLSVEAYEGFVTALDNPPEPTEKLRALFQDTAPWDR